MSRHWLWLAGLLAAWAAQDRLVPVDAAGYRQLVASQRGQIVLVDFWATWCEPCLKELPELIALHKRLGGRFRLITISADEPEQEAEAASLLRKLGAPQPAYIKRPGDDDAFIRAVDPAWSGALPALFIYDRQGRKVRSFVGETSISTIEAALRALR